MLIRLVAVACAAVLLFAATSARAQQYHDTSGTVVQGVVPLGGCTPGGNCIGPIGAAAPVIAVNLKTPVVIKASPGQIAKVQCDNLAGTANAWVELINVAATPALGTSVLDQVALAPGGTNGFALASGELFTTGISIGAATASNGGTAVSTGVNCSVTFN